MADRERFGKLAIIMALAGSAIGLGNIWRFPYIVGEYGGAAFIIVYLLCSLFISLPIFISESIIGRRAGQSTYCALHSLSRGTKWKWLGLVAVAGAFIISSFYSVVGGWSADFMLRAGINGFSSSNPESVSTIFTAMSTSVWEPLLAHTAFLGISILIVVLGIKNGIERFSKISIPLLFVLIVVMMVVSLLLPGAQDGVEYLLKPDFSKLSAKGISCALGQSFFSMSLGVGAVLTYSSYMKKSQSILSTSVWTLIFDALFAIIASFVVMPAVFSAGLKPGAGPALVFESIPFIFAKMGTVAPFTARIVSTTFFFTIVVAALTSEISMLEVCVSQLVERMRYSRKKASILVFVAAWIVGALCSLSFGPLSGVSIFGNSIFGLCDRLSSNYFMTLCSLGFAVFVGWKMDRVQVKEEFTNNGTLKPSSAIFNVFYFLIKYIIPPVILLIFFTNLM